MVIASIIMPPTAQETQYHQFVDQRSYFGIPNFLNVVSNIFIFLAGLIGFIFLLCSNKFLIHKTFIHFSERWSYIILFLNVLVAGITSAYYHLEPDNARLMWDRIPIAIGIVTFLSITLMERISINFGLILLPILTIFGIGSVIYWYCGEQYGLGNLNYYIVIQFYSILAIAILGKYFSSIYTRSNDVYIVVILYAIAKLVEILDYEIYSLGQVISGHTVKHLIIGLAIFWITYSLYKRRPV
ncbi:MAG: alkaline phytoceramidase [Nitrosomonadaceae bacterium]|nr:alkaline phytoceramidase [Nitrosomonadaceae bacterium]